MMIEKIKQLCEERNSNLSKLERACGFANSTIRRWENSSPSAENLKKVADYFDVSVDYLLDRGVFCMSQQAQDYAKQFEALPEDKKQLAMAYMGVVVAQ